MARKRFASIPEYTRHTHKVRAHKRQLSDGVMMLELAEGNGEGDIQDLEFILVPDPFLARKEIFVREDVVRELDDTTFSKVMDYVSSWNDPKLLQRIAKRRNYLKFYSMNDGEEGGTDWAAVVETVGSAIEVVGSWFDSGSGSDSSGNENPGTIVSTNGMVFCIRTIQGQLVGFGLDPAGRRLIAFSNPNEVVKYFPDLPGGNFPHIQLPSVVPSGMVQKALENPNKIIRIKPGTNNVYQVVTPVITGNDGNGNPEVGGTDGTGGTADDPKGSGFGALLPIGLIGSLLFLK